MEKQLDLFENQPVEPNFKTCIHCGGEHHFVEGEPMITGACMIMACTRCTFKTKRTFVGDIANPDYSQLVEIWNHGTPSLVFKHGTNRLMTIAEYFDLFPKDRPELLV